MKRRGTYAPVPRPAVWDRVLFQGLAVVLLSLIGTALAFGLLTSMGFWR